jgi:hypothetical protein
MKKFCNEGNQIHNVISSSGSRIVINSGSDFLTLSYGFDYGSTSQKVTVRFHNAVAACTMAQESRIKMDTTGLFEYEKNSTNLERDT